MHDFPSGAARHVHISGPMTSVPNYNRAAFAGVADLLGARGHKVFNPTDLPYDGTARGYRNALGLNLRYVTDTADAQVLLPGWRDSPGAQAEAAAAKACEIEQWEYVGGQFTEASAL